MNLVFFNKIWPRVTHRNKFDENQINILERYRNSPDLNPTKNLWSIGKQQVCGMDCTTR